MKKEELIKKLFAYALQFKDRNEVVLAELPILYFGDLEAYEKSDLKVISVGKNPSNNEFREGNEQSYSSKYRFPKWKAKQENLEETLNAYFEENPLKWFSCFEPLLNGLETSYYRGEQKNQAIHTDVCTPLATDPTWSKLDKGLKKELFAEGLAIWNALVELLQADVIVVSIPKKLFEEVFKCYNLKLVKSIALEEKKDGTKRAHPYISSIYEGILKSGKPFKLLFGQAANIPFGLISNEQKKNLGLELKHLTTNNELKDGKDFLRTKNLRED